MPIIEEHKSLQEFNTFGIDCNARFFVSIQSVAELQEVLQQDIHPKLFILGGGSNMLLTQDVDALVIHINNKGVSIVDENETQVTLEAAAGENWHDFVLYCIANDYGGIENLSLIPGNVGTAPIQNIGAYGVELKDVFKECTAIDIERNTEVSFSKKECQFEYRNSIFKSKVKGKYIITSVTFVLQKPPHHIQSSYGAIASILNQKHISNPSIQDISETVITIRQSKLPDPAELGNSGSFFKNPIVDLATFQEFKEQNPTAPYYEVSATSYKIPAGWLIEQAGFKGKRYGDAGVHKNQALVLVNYGNATGNELWELALKIQKKVKDVFGIFIEPEVNVI